MLRFLPIERNNNADGLILIETSEIAFRGRIECRRKGDRGKKPRVLVEKTVAVEGNRDKSEQFRGIPRDGQADELRRSLARSSPCALKRTHTRESNGPGLVCVSVQPCARLCTARVCLQRVT